MLSRFAPAFQFSPVKFDLCFSPRGFCGYFLSDIFRENQFGNFSELCILLCYEVFILKFRKRVSILVSLLFAILFVLAQFCRSCQPFFNFTILHSVSLFCIGEIALFTNLGLIDMFSANQAAEIVACILLHPKSSININGAQPSQNFISYVAILCVQSRDLSRNQLK